MSLPDAVLTHASGPSEVVFDDVSFTYDNDVQAIDGLSLDIPKGKSVAIIGPSGCGKSTLLFLLAGIYAPDRGTIRWPGGDALARRQLSMVFQKDTLLPWLSVRENIELYYRFNRSRRPADLPERIRELVSLASLQGFEDSSPHELSGGMKRRVAFLSAVASMPETLLLDEPFSSLDEPTRVSIHQDVFRIIRSLSTTMVLVTHDLAEAISLCDEVVILTNRPASVYKSFDIPFGPERNMMELRREPEFLEIYGQLWAQLGTQIRQAGSPEVEAESMLRERSA